MNEPLSEQFYKAAQEWVGLEAAASLLEDTKSSVLSQRMGMLGDMAVNKAEMEVKRSLFWQDHLVTINEARQKANFAKVRVDYMRMRFNEWQSTEANARVEARL
jgi:hypothetical protein